VKIERIPLGGGAPLVLIAGLNVIETEKETLQVARLVRDIAERHELPLVFKASFDKANRSSCR
jgi:2-dehydro-3-deoxyphosphooctonate aldolase (KDO 8-P synthase)